MNIDAALQIIEKLRLGVPPSPTRSDVKEAYQAIFEKCGVHAEPLRTHIFGSGALTIGRDLGVRLSKYNLECHLKTSNSSRGELFI